MCKKNKNKDKGFFADFKKFISRGNVVDMAVGVVVGGAFGKIVTGFVNYIINPFVGLFIKNGNLNSLKTIINAATYAEDGTTVATPEVAILWGTWIQTIIDFIIVAFCIFVVVRLLNKTNDKIHAKQIAEKAAEDKAAAEKAEAEKKAAEEAAAVKAEEDRALRTSLLAQETILRDIASSLRK